MRRFKDVLKFGKPKGPNVSISKSYYLTVLAAKAQLPPIIEIVTPKGEGNTVAGMGAPMSADSSKEDLAAPMVRGVYAIASPDQKTVIKMMVMPKEEAGYDPAAFARSEAAKAWKPEVRARVESTWMILQLTFETYSPEVYPALDFFLAVASRLALLTDGTVADPVSRVYRLPEDVVSIRPEGEPILARDHIQINFRQSDENWHVFTLGLTKFDHPELEVYGITDDARPAAERFLLGLAQATLRGQKLEAGALVGARSGPMQVAVGGLDKRMWEGIPCFELIADGNTDQSVAIKAWSRELEG